MSPQQTIAHYRITAKLGEGGMGAVYRATDTKLNREVAVKILPDTFANDPDRMARFAREAQVLASLNHPNIAAIYGVEERALILELVEGPTLAERIAQGPVPVEEALAIAKQIAEALEYAHEKGIVHRDLKPANIKLTPEGRVKVLDFGLAAVAQAFQDVSSDPMSSPTLTMRATLVGTIMGTAGYMSPEQARGQAVDKRADIWAFGVVLYEMLTGRQLFAGPTISDTLAEVLKTEVDLSAVPAHVRKLVKFCLTRDPRQRLRDIGDARIALEEAGEAEYEAAAAPALKSNTGWKACTTALAIALLVAAGLLWRATRPEERPLTRLSVDLGPEAVAGLNHTAAISPDGRRLAFLARGPDGRQQLATRLLDQDKTTLLPGTENGSEPFFSPDGQWIGFYSNGALKKISVQGGAPMVLRSTGGPALWGASWGEDGYIVAPMGTLVGLSRIPEAGGAPQPLTKLAPGETSHRWPQVLPGGKAVLFTASGSANRWDTGNIEAVSPKTGQVKIVQRGGYSARYLPSGHLVFVHEGTLFGAKFDPEKLEFRGSPVPLLGDLAANAINGGGQFDFSQTGTFVYAAGKSLIQTWQIAWMDQSGKVQPVIATSGTYTLPRLSPDGRKLAFIGDGNDVYIHDLDRDTTSRLTFSGRANTPVWAPDGKHLVVRDTGNGYGLSWTRSDGAGEPLPLLDTATNALPYSFSPDGRHLAYFQSSGDTGFDIWTAPLDVTDPERPKAGKPELFLRTPADEMLPQFSPDGRWIAYRSNESGSNEIYVRPFPAGNGGKWQVSDRGGLYALWAKNGRELFYETADNRIMVTDYSVDGASFVPGKPRMWCDKQLFYPGTSNLDLAPDGKRFIIFSKPESAAGSQESVHVTFLQNYFDELRRKLP